MNIVFFGTPQFAVPSLERLLAHPEFRVLAIVSQPDKRRGRGNNLTPSPVKAVAVAHNLPVWQPRRIKKDPETLEKLQNAQADVFVVVAYGQILSEAILAMPTWGCVNAHGSILPKYRGAAPIQWSLYHGETETGITTMLMDVGMDTGAMLLKSTTPIALLETAHDLADRLSHLSADLLVETLPKLQHQELTPIAQVESQATYAPLIQKSDYALDWSRSAIALHNQIRGFYPNCTTTLRGDSLKIIATAPLGAPYDCLLPTDLASIQTGDFLSQPPVSPGTIVHLLKHHGAILQTGDGLLLLRQVQLAGKRPQSGWDFANGSRLSVGEKLG
ncbi:MAG TPA: methionyl-tRNA formyltransferase [Thermosynechococcaceae cyanobacterium]